MILQYRDDLPAFRAALRQWLATAVTPEIRKQAATAEGAEQAQFQRMWMSKLNEVGLATPHWPAEYGGADVELVHQVIIADEMAKADVPTLSMFAVSLNHIPATLVPFGTEHQRNKYLPGIPKGDIWCQGFSEPNSGSDLASLQCKAENRGDHYLVNGQKIWSSFSLHARYCILLTRTDFSASKHRGITYFVLDMQAPGVEVRPIRQATGQREFGEIFLTDVVIPIEDRIGEENDGWRVAQATLAAERGVIAFENAERRRYVVEAFYRRSVETDAPWLKDDQMRREFATLFAELQASRRLIRQLLASHGAASSIIPAIVKLTSTTHQQRLASFAVRAMGNSSQEAASPGDPMGRYLSSFGSTIAAGTSEIMRNIIAERGLGMPRA